MADATAVEIAQEMVESLNGASFSRPFTARRAYVVDHSLKKDLQTLQVAVVPSETESGEATRGSSREDHAIDVGIMQRVADDAETDALMRLVEEIKDHFRRRAITTVSGRRLAWSADVNAPLYSPTHLREEGVFLSVLTVTWRIWR